jgi:hypothetical protein
MPEVESATPLQRKFLLSCIDKIRDLLTPEERCNAEIMGFDVWLDAIDKWEASHIIGLIKGGGVAEEIRRRSEKAPPTKWWQTGLSQPTGEKS